MIQHIQLVLSLCGILLTAGLQAQHIDTIITFDPDTYEETTVILEYNTRGDIVSFRSSALRKDNAPGCFVFITGTDVHPIGGESLQIRTTRAAVRDDLFENMQFAAFEGCPQVRGFKDFYVVLDYPGIDQVLEMDHFNKFIKEPGSMERLLYNAMSVTFKDIFLKMEDGSTQQVPDVKMFLTR